MKTIDETRVPEFLKMIDELTSTHIEIGIFGEDDSDLLLIAHVNEFGANIKVTDKMRAYLHHVGLHLKASTREINIPERSFLRSGYDTHKNKIINNIEPLLKKVIALELPVDAFFDTLGEYIVGQLQDYLTSIKAPANHPFTIEQKGSNNPLINTGKLRESITYKVVR